MRSLVNQLGVPPDTKKNLAQKITKKLVSRKNRVSLLFIARLYINLKALNIIENIALAYNKVIANFRNFVKFAQNGQIQAKTQFIRDNLIFGSFELDEAVHK